MTKLTWFDQAEAKREVAFPRDKGTLVFYYRDSFGERLVEFNGITIGVAEDRAHAEEVLKEWAAGLLSVL